MARSSKFRHNPDLDKADVTDPLHSNSSPDTDIIVINDGRVGINLPRNKIGSLGSRDPEHTLHVSGDVNIEGPAEIGGDISGNKNLKIKEDATISGDLNVSGDFKTSGSIDASGDITTLGKITTMGDLDVGGDIKTTGEWDVSGNVRFHADVFVKDDLRVSGDFHVEEDYVVGKPTSGMLASFSGDQITFGEKESGQLAEFDTGIRFFVRPTVSGTGVLLEGEGGTMGSSTISDLAVQNDLVVSGNLFVSGETTVQNVTDVSVTGDISGHTGRFKKIFVDGNEVIDVSDTGNFYPKSNPSGFITGIETGGFVTTGYSGLVEIASGNFTKSLTISGNPVLTGSAGSTSPFCFFYDAINHNGLIQKTYYEAKVPGKQNLMLSGITVDDASDLTLRLRFDGPDDDYVGTASINSNEIPTGNLSEHSAETRRFNGFIRGDFGGLNGFVTGLANGRNSVLTLNELGGGPEATALYIDEIANSTPKAGHARGTTALKEDDSINVFAEFDTNDVTGIKVDSFGLAKGVSYASYSLTDIGGGKYKATIPVTVSSLTGPQSVRIQAKNSFGTEGGAVLSSGPSGQRTLDPLYPSIDANINYLNDWKSSQQGLGWDAVSSDAVSGRYSLSITNFSNGVDLFTGSLGEDSSDDRVLFTDSAGSSLGRSIETYASNLNVLFNTGYAGVRDNKYDSNFKMIVAVQRVSNGAKVSKNSPLQIHNSPQVLTDGKLDQLAFRAQSPHIIGQSEHKQGDLVSGEFTIYTKGASTSDIKYKVDQTQGWGSGPTSSKSILPGAFSQTFGTSSFGGNIVSLSLQRDASNNVTRIDLNTSSKGLRTRDAVGTSFPNTSVGKDGNFANQYFTSDAGMERLDVNFVNGEISSITDNANGEVLVSFSSYNESNAGQYNSFIDAHVTGQVGSTSSALTDLYANFTNNSSNVFDDLSYPATGSTVVNNSDVPALYLSDTDYPVNQSGLKNSETATINFEKNNIDTLYIADNGLGGAGQLNFSNQSQFDDQLEYYGDLVVRTVLNQPGGHLRVHMSGPYTTYTSLRFNILNLGNSPSVTTSGNTLIISYPKINAGGLRFPFISEVMSFINSQANLSAVPSSGVNVNHSGLQPTSGNTQTVTVQSVPKLGSNGQALVKKDVSRSAGSYNISAHNFTIAGTKTSNGLKTSVSDTVNIAHAAPVFNVRNLPASLQSTSGTVSNTTFYIEANQQLNRELSLGLDPTQSNQPSLSKSVRSALPTSTPNNFVIGVTDVNTKGQFTFQFTGSGIGGQEVTVITNNQNYTISGFSEREIYASPQSLGAGLAYLGTNVVDPNNVSMENISESIGGGVGKSYSYKSYPNGTQMTATIDFDDQFTITNSAGETNTTGDYIYNLDKANRAGNAVAPGALYKIKED